MRGVHITLIMMIIAFLSISTASSTWLGGQNYLNGKVPMWGCWAEEVQSFTMSEDGSRAALSIGETLKCVNGLTGDEYWSYTDPNGKGITSEISVDGNYILAWTMEGALLFSTETGDTLWTTTFLPGPRGFLSGSISDNGSRFLIMYNGDGYLRNLKGEMVIQYDLGDSPYARGKISGDGQKVVAVDNNNEYDKNSTIYYFSTLSSEPVWTKELVGNEYSCEISRSGDVVFFTQHDLGTFIEQDPWGISHTLPSDYQVGTMDHFGGGTLFSGDGELLWTVEMEGIESYDLDRNGNWFTFSGMNRKCVLMDRTQIKRSLVIPENRISYNCRVTSDGTWLHSEGRNLVVYDEAGNRILYRSVAGSATYRSIQYTRLSDDGDYYYYCTNGAFHAYDFGPYPEATIEMPDMIYMGEPAKIDISVKENGLNVTTVEWYFNGTLEPTLVTEKVEPIDLTFYEMTGGQVYAVVNTEEGYSGVTQAELWVQMNMTKEKSKDSGGSAEILLVMTLVISIFILTTVLKNKVRKR